MVYFDYSVQMVGKNEVYAVGTRRSIKRRRVSKCVIKDRLQERKGTNYQKDK